MNVDPADARYRRPLERSASALAADIGADCEVILLGSIASAKYVDVLLRIFAGRLLFPAEFVGRGDMSRGGLMLRWLLYWLFEDPYRSRIPSLVMGSVLVIVAVQIWVVAFLADLQAASRRLLAEARARDRKRALDLE